MPRLPRPLNTRIHQEELQMGRLSLALGSLSPCSARLLSQGTMPATVSDVRCRRLRCRLQGSNQCDNYAGIEPTSDTHEHLRHPAGHIAQVLQSFIYRIMSQTETVRLASCGFALLLRCSRSIHNPKQSRGCFIIARITANHMRQSLLHVLTCLPTAPWSLKVSSLFFNVRYTRPMSCCTLIM